MIATCRKGSEVSSNLYSKVIRGDCLLGELFFGAIPWKKTSSNGPKIVTSKVAFLILPVSVRKAFSIARKQHMSWNSWMFASHGWMVLVNIQSRKISISCVLVIWSCCFRGFSTLLVLIAWVPGFPMTCHARSIFYFNRSGKLLPLH